jgi:hypothetical protein
MTLRLAAAAVPAPVAPRRNRHTNECLPTASPTKFSSPGRLLEPLDELGTTLRTRRTAEPPPPLLLAADEPECTEETVVVAEAHGSRLTGVECVLLGALVVTVVASPPPRDGDDESEVDESMSRLKEGKRRWYWMVFVACVASCVDDVSGELNSHCSSSNGSWSTARASSQARTTIVHDCGIDHIRRRRT